LENKKREWGSNWKAGKGVVFIRLVAVEGFEWGNLSFFRMPRQILQSKSGMFGEKFNEGIRKKDFLPAKATHRNKSISLPRLQKVQKPLSLRAFFGYFLWTGFA